ncbi:hypothetical protein M422DRAFT_63729 [Sphaerobolus stellatus SS14]|nr:hypothetical protein M422DRAFT_63729 [Sphaerobolus stellatus SS14]
MASQSLLGEYSSSKTTNYNTFSVTRRLNPLRWNASRSETKEGYSQINSVEEGEAYEKDPDIIRKPSAEGFSPVDSEPSTRSGGIFCGIRFPSRLFNALDFISPLLGILRLSNMKRRWKKVMKDSADIELDVVLTDFTWLLKQMRNSNQPALVRRRAQQLLVEWSQIWDSPNELKRPLSSTTYNLYTSVLMFRISCLTYETSLTDERFKEADIKIRDYLFYGLTVDPIANVACQIMGVLGRELLRCTSTSPAFTKLGLLLSCLLEPVLTLRDRDHERILDDSALEQTTTVLFKAIQAWERRFMKAGVEPGEESYLSIRRALHIISQLAARKDEVWFDRPTLMAIWDIARILTLFTTHSTGKSCIPITWSTLKDITRRQSSATDIIQEEILAREQGMAFYHDDLTMNVENNSTIEPPRRQLDIDGQPQSQIHTEIPVWYKQTAPMSLALYHELNRNIVTIVGTRSTDGGFKGKGKILMSPPESDFPEC